MKKEEKPKEELAAIGAAALMVAFMEEVFLDGTIEDIEEDETRGS